MTAKIVRRWLTLGVVSLITAFAWVACEGPSGIVGAAGETGAAGPQGEAGDKGDTGDTGGTGPQGEAGAQGEKGDTGETGATGDTGAQGEKGDTGETGATGDPGAQGETGDTGETGATGDPGAQGEKGDTGETGATGDPGAQGETGDTGETGATGDPGAQGETGDTGEQGSDARTGPAFTGKIGTVVVNDVGGKLGAAAMLNANNYFIGDGLGFDITSVVHPYGTTCTEDTDPEDADPCGPLSTRMTIVPTIMLIEEMPEGSGMFVITPTSDAEYGASQVTIRATDANDLWAEQMFDVRCNRRPMFNLDPTEIDMAVADRNVYLGTVAQKMHTLHINDLFTDDDEIIVDDMFNSFPDIGTLMVSDLLGTLTATALKDGITEVTVRAQDTGGLTATHEVRIYVYAGPQLVDGAPDSVTMTDGQSTNNTVDLLNNFVKPATTNPSGEDVADATGDPGGAVYSDEKSSNESVATIALSDATVTVTPRTVGSTTIMVTVTQATGPTGDGVTADDRFEQSLTVEFTLNVVS